METSENDVMTDRIEVTVLGKVLGTADEFDDIDTNTPIYYGFEPSEGVNIPDGDLIVDYDEGKFEISDDDGATTWSSDILPVLVALP